MKFLLLLALLTSNTFAGVTKENCISTIQDPEIDTKTGVEKTVTTIVCSKKKFTDKEVADALKEMEEAKKKSEKTVDKKDKK